MDTKTSISELLHKRNDLQEQVSMLLEEIKILKEARKILSLMGADEKSLKKTDFTVFHFCKPVVSAKLIFADGNYIVKAGSEVDVLNLVFMTNSSILEKRKLAIAQKVLVPIDLSSSPEKYRLETDIIFSDPSEAASFVGGGIRNGWMDWIDDDGNPLYDHKAEIEDTQHVKVKRKERAKGGHTILTPSESEKPQESEKRQIKENFTEYKYQIHRGKIESYLTIKNGQYILCSGSGVNISMPVGPEWEKVGELRLKARKLGWIEIYGIDKYRTIMDICFSSPAAAAVFVLGGSRKGDEWIGVDGSPIAIGRQEAVSCKKKRNSAEGR